MTSLVNSSHQLVSYGDREGKSWVYFYRLGKTKYTFTIIWNTQKTFSEFIRLGIKGGN